ncbi:hypothetical protein L1049_023118 [Liquidambar formosana]|uniref:Reverse transcriptase zinc-binding domain-containing protein n=1 Tax=Liquidambar formosana TaxID=63359 RepID=A0AAP0WSV1_LIQFO
MCTEKLEKSKLKWSAVCTPKEEGGLGLRRIEDINIAAAMKHIWKIFMQAGSLWVAWVNIYLIKGRSFWSLSIPSDCSWTWRKILQIRSKVRPLFKHVIGNGEVTFLWHDNWHPLGPLLPRFGTGVIYDAAIPLDAKVSYIIVANAWNWPLSSTGELMILQSSIPPNLSPH